MSLNAQIGLRIDPQTHNMLRKLCDDTIRTKSDMVRFLIRKEHLRRYCMHENTVIESTGSRRFVEGDLVEDIREFLVCRDCGKVINGE